MQAIPVWALKQKKKTKGETQTTGWESWGASRKEEGV